MPYRVRPADYSTWVSGMTAANEIRLRGVESRNRGILAGLLGFREGVERAQDRGESKRRFDAQQANETRSQDRADAALAIRMAEYEDEQAAYAEEAQANRSRVLDALGIATEAATVEAATTGEVSPDTSRTLQQGTDALGGPQAVMQAWSRRMTGGGGVMAPILRPSAPT